jgi:hypothetical protein
MSRRNLPGLRHPLWIGHGDRLHPVGGARAKQKVVAVDQEFHGGHRHWLLEEICLEDWLGENTIERCFCGSFVIGRLAGQAGE